MTFSRRAPASPFERVSDPSVAYDAAHGTWLISSIPLLPNTSVVPTVFVNRSTDDGRDLEHAGLDPAAGLANRSTSTRTGPSATTHPSSPFCGHCYTELDNFGEGDRELMSTSTDGGLTWSVPIPTAGHDKGLGGQPVVQPNGTVIVPFESLNGKIEAFAVDRRRRLVDEGGHRRRHPLPRRRRRPAHEPAAERRDRGRRHRVRGLGGLPLPQAVRGQRHRLQQSPDGVDWSDAARVPIDGVTSGVDHFIPGLAVDPALPVTTRTSR